MRAIIDFAEQTDLLILGHINSYAGSSEIVDRFMLLVSNNHMFKGVVIAILFWSLWFLPSLSDAQNRSRLLSVLLVSAVAIIIGRVLGENLPFRIRPIHAPDLEVAGPLVESGRLESYSSFPSDHAVLYFGIAFGIMFVSRLAGIVALLHAALLISLPRIYLGLHYPGDILAGALVGVAISVALVPTLSASTSLRKMLQKSEEHYAFLFYPGMFFVTFQFASMFESVRQAGRALVSLVLPQ